MQILVAYASKSGSTADIAGWVSDALRAAGHTVTLAAAPEAPAPDAFDAVFVGSGIRAGQWDADGVAWLTRHAAALRARPVVTFSGSLQAADGAAASQAQVAGYTTKVVAPLGIRPVAHGNLVGAYDPTRVSLPERLVMKALGRGQASDQRDPAAVRAWVAQVLSELAVP